MLVDRLECVHAVVTSPMLEVPTAENPTAKYPLAHHLNDSTGSPRHYCQR